LLALLTEMFVRTGRCVGAASAPVHPVDWAFDRQRLCVARDEERSALGLDPGEPCVCVGCPLLHLVLYLPDESQGFNHVVLRLLDPVAYREVGEHVVEPAGAVADSMPMAVPVVG
jgi:hypothetical protein